jgi:ubiquinone/menaquinone biosynthesis C-methylase UbiE
VRKATPRRVRRTVFGGYPRRYDRARLRYPARLFRILESRCGLGPGAVVFEVGPGTGIATRELLARGAGPVTVVEADVRQIRYLRRRLGAGARRVRFVHGPFESVRLPSASFDLGVAATSFHWVPQRAGLRRVARALRPGGWWAYWNNHYGDPSRPGPFHDAIQPLYRTLYGRSQSRAAMRRQLARATAQRLRRLRGANAFEAIRLDRLHWTATLDGRRVAALWSTFSEISTLPPPDRRWFLTQLRRLVRDRFGDHATIHVLTPLFTARRKAAVRIPRRGQASHRLQTSHRR